MRDIELYRHLLGVGVASLLALGFTSLAQAAPGDLDPSFGQEDSSFSLGEGQSQEVVVRFSPSSKALSLDSVSVDSDGGSAGVRLIGKGK